MRMNPLDAVWLMMESSDTPMHVGVLAQFCKPRNAGKQYLREWVDAQRNDDDAIAPWNLRLSDPHPVLAAPRLFPERNLDMEYHLRHIALPEPGGQRELGAVVSRLHSQPLDRYKPLWELHLIEGLARDRFALYVKIHHALIDNVNAIPLVTSWLSESVRARKNTPLWQQSITVSPETQEATQASLLEVWDKPLATAASIGKASSGFFRDAFKAGSQRRFLTPFGTPRSTLNRRINAQRRFATWQFARSRIDFLADASDSTVNEILAYLCGSSLRRFFKEYNALPEESLIGAIPVSLAERSDALPGNAIAGLRVALGTHIGDPLTRLEAVKASVQEVARDRASLPADSVAPYVLMRATPTFASQTPGLGRFVPPLFNLSLSTTDAAATPLYLRGARLESIYSLNLLMQYSALSIDCVSYAGTYNIGFTGARDTLPHLQRLAVYLGLAADELQAMLEQLERAS